jgi:hypothetical protein
MKNDKVANAKNSEVPLQASQQAAVGGVYAGKKLTAEQWKAEGVELKIDPALKTLLGDQPLSEESLENLTHSLLHDPGGCRDPIRVWHKDTIVDGHNRHTICCEHGIPFGIEEIEADTVEDVKVWMYRNQLGRRNLSKAQRACLVVWKHELMGDKHELEAKHHQQSGGVLPNSVKPINTQAELAECAGVGHDMIWRLQQVYKKAPEKVKDVYEGKLSVNRAFNDVAAKAKSKPALKPQRWGAAKKGRCGYCGTSLICPKCTNEFMASDGDDTHDPESD